MRFDQSQIHVTLQGANLDVTDDEEESLVLDAGGWCVGDDD